VIAYASRTGTKRNLAALRAADWRLLVSARGVLRTEGFRYALDNGAWTAHQKGEAFDVPAFDRAVDLLGEGADWTVLPDIVGAGHRSLAFSLSWLPRLAPLPGRLLIAVQDGLEPADVRPYLSDRVGIAVGGSTEWKIKTIPSWGRLAQETGCWLHVLRVNSVKRILLCQDAQATSFDGSGVSRFAKHLEVLEAYRRQRHLMESF
jgi:hypothetical protein